MKLETLLRQYCGLTESAGQQTRTDSRLTQLPDRIEDWPEELLEQFRERAAIMEYEGGLSRQGAEKEAEQLIRKNTESLLISMVGEKHNE
jgi:hypothetical protein